MDYVYAEADDAYFEETLTADAGGMIGEGGIPGVTSVANSGTGIKPGTGGNIPSAAQRKKKRRLAAGGGPSLGDKTTKGGFEESVGRSGY